MVQFSKNVKKNNERLDEVSEPLYFLKDQTAHYINICISSPKMIFYKISILTAYLSTIYISSKEFHEKHLIFNQELSKL